MTRKKLRGGEKTKANKNLMLGQLYEQNLHIGRACQQVGISRRTHYKWLKEDEVYAEKVHEMEEYWKDEMEMALKKLAINNLSSRDIQYFLRTKAKDRGYGEKQEMSHSFDDGLKIEIKDPTQENKENE